MFVKQEFVPPKKVGANWLVPRDRVGRSVLCS